jgi:hypothetical protein
MTRTQLSNGKSDIFSAGLSRRASVLKHVLHPDLHRIDRLRTRIVRGSPLVPCLGFYLVLLFSGACITHLDLLPSPPLHDGTLNISPKLLHTHKSETQLSTRPLINSINKSKATNILQADMPIQQLGKGL